MALDKLVDSTQLDSDLTDVADEIRTAGGTLLPLSFPDDYVVAIGDIGNTEIKTASGSIAHFEDALARKAQDLTVGIEPVQSGSGDPSPSNIRPISGWTGANIHVSPITVAADGTTYSITFPTEAGTVYGGSLDVTTGKLRSEWLMCDGGDLDWVKVSNSNFRNFYAKCPDIMFYANDVSSILSSAYKSTNNNDASASDDLYVWATALRPNNTISVKDTAKGSMTAEEFKEAMAGVQFVYKLDTPIEYDLTPTEVTTLLGMNNVWADTGNSTIKYIAPKAQIPSAQGVYF